MSANGVGAIRFLCRTTAVAAATLSQTVPAVAQRLDDTLTLRVEAYFAGIGTSARVDSRNGRLGTTVDFENDLSMDPGKTLPAVELGWRIDDDWLLQGQYYGLGRRVEATLERDITIGESLFPVSARAAAGFDSDVYRFTLNNLVFQGERFEIGLGVGLHATDFNMFVEGDASVSGNPLAFRREQRRIFAPLPTLGTVGQWEPVPRLTLFGRVDWLSLTIDDYSGRLINAEASIAYTFHRNLDIGTSYRFVDYRLRVNKADWNGEVRYQFSGPSLFLRAGF